MSNIANNVATAAMTASIATVRNLDRLYAASALTMGMLLIFGVGFAQPELLHNAAHDGRHSFVFPCH